MARVKLNKKFEKYTGTPPPNGSRFYLTERYVTVHHNKFALAMHPWQEPENNARAIATKHHLRLLDAKIGEKVDF